MEPNPGPSIVAGLLNIWLFFCGLKPVDFGGGAVFVCVCVCVCVPSGILRYN